jgi:hypothetical protein
MDLSSLIVFYNHSKIIIQYWNYDKPKLNGATFLSGERIKLTFDSKILQTTLQNIVNNLSNQPFFYNFNITHIIFPDLPDWIVNAKQETDIVIFIRGDSINTNQISGGLLHGY